MSSPNVYNPPKPSFDKEGLGAVLPEVLHKHKSQDLSFSFCICWREGTK